MIASPCNQSLIVLRWGLLGNFGYYRRRFLSQKLHKIVDIIGSPLTIRVSSHVRAPDAVVVARLRHQHLIVLPRIGMTDAPVYMSPVFFIKTTFPEIYERALAAAAKRWKIKGRPTRVWLVHSHARVPKIPRESAAGGRGRWLTPWFLRCCWFKGIVALLFVLSFAADWGNRRLDCLKSTKRW